MHHALPHRYSTAGLAHSAADHETERTGIPHRMREIWLRGRVIFTIEAVPA